MSGALSSDVDPLFIFIFHFHDYYWLSFLVYICLFLCAVFVCLVFFFFFMFKCVLVFLLVISVNLTIRFHSTRLSRSKLRLLFSLSLVPDGGKLARPPSIYAQPCTLSLVLFSFNFMHTCYSILKSLPWKSEKTHSLAQSSQYQNLA